MEDSVDIRPAEELWIPSPSGKSIHTFIVKPSGFDPARKYPLILNVHGGPQSQWADAFRGDWQVYPGSGYIVAFPNPHGSTGYGQEFTPGFPATGEERCTRSDGGDGFAGATSRTLMPAGWERWAGRTGAT